MRKQTIAARRGSAYDVITDRILALLEAGTVPWQQPWAGGEPPRNVRGTAYRGVNVFLLACQGYASPVWLTFKQAKEHGGAVRRGERSTPVVFWRPPERQWDGVDPDPEGSQRRGLVLRYYSVFNSEQCDLPTGVVPVLRAESGVPFEPIAACEAIVDGMPHRPAIRHGGGHAFYRPSTDDVAMPLRTAFRSPEAYYATLFHELGHSTGHASRLDRKTLTDLCPFGSTNYSREELVAEMTAAFLCGRGGIEPATIDDSAAYIAGWLRRLRGAPRMVVVAGAQAQRAADYVLGVRALEGAAS
jgi:antirestriction protein ArdC